MRWVGRCQYHEGEGWVQLAWWPDLLPSLVGLKLAKVGTNLNQVAKAFNTLVKMRGGAEKFPEVGKKIASLRREITEHTGKVLRVLVSRHRSDVVGCAQASGGSARRSAQPKRSFLTGDTPRHAAPMPSEDQQMIGDATLEAGTTVWEAKGRGQRQRKRKKVEKAHHVRIWDQ